RATMRTQIWSSSARCGENCSPKPRCPVWMTEPRPHHGRIAGPKLITARTSGRCAADYGTHGYDLRTIRHGERLAERSGPFRLWIELAVIAHLIGRPTRPLPAHVEEQIADQ